VVVVAAVVVVVAAVVVVVAAVVVVVTVGLVVVVAAVVVVVRAGLVVVVAAVVVVVAAAGRPEKPDGAGGSDAAVVGAAPLVVGDSVVGGTEVLVVPVPRDGLLRTSAGVTANFGPSPKVSNLPSELSSV
jgi:hypothetical protein